jgi:hypothetical protein
MGFHEEAAKAFRSKAHPEGTDPERKVWEIRARVTIEVWLEGMGLPAYAIPEITFGSSIIAGRVYAGWTLEGYEYRAWVGDELEEVELQVRDDWHRVYGEGIPDSKEAIGRVIALNTKWG